MPDGKAAVWRTRDAGSSWQRLDRGLPSENAYVGVLRDCMAIDDHDTPGLYFGTSTGQLFASADEGESWSAIGGLFPRDHVGHVREHGLMAELHLPAVLAPLFPGLPREARGRSGDGQRRDRPAERAVAGPAGPPRRARAEAAAAYQRLGVDRARGGLESSLEVGSRVDVIAAISGG